MTGPATPRIVSRDEWERARAELLVREKAHTHAGDELAAARRRLPMTRMEPVIVVGPDGPVPLHVVFEGRRMLIVYHFMWNKSALHHKQCEGCTHSQAANSPAGWPQDKAGSWWRRDGRPVAQWTRTNAAVK